MSRIGIALLLFLAACSPGGGEKEGTSGATLRRRLVGVKSMDPIHSEDVYNSRVVSLVYEPLLEVDYGTLPYRLKAGVCDLPEVGTNRLEYTFRLRDGVRFQDDPCFPEGEGRAATAQDVVYSLSRLRDPANASPGKWTMDNVDKVEAVDVRTVVITLKKPSHVFEWLMAMAYAAVVPHEAVEKYGDSFGQHAVGTGPYRLAEWWRNYRMTFTRDAAWRGWAEIGNPSPYAKIEFVFVGDSFTEWLMFLGKEMDSLDEVTRNNWDAVVGKDGELVPALAKKGMQLHSAPKLQVSYVGMNMNDPLLGTNKKLRQALNCAFDAPKWKQFFNGRVEPADGPVPPGVDGRLETETPFAYAFNVEKARKLLAEAGFPDGIDPKTGKRLVIPIALGRADQGAREEVELLQGFYDRVGIRLEPQHMTWGAFLEAVNKGHTSLFMLGWVGDYPDAENFLQLFHSKNCAPGANHGNYRNPEFDKCYDEAMATTNPEVRRAAWMRAQEIVREDCPWIFLSYPKAYTITWDHVGNYHLTDFPYGTEKYLRAGK